MVVASSQAAFLSEVSEEDSEELAEDEVTPDETVKFVPGNIRSALKDHSFINLKFISCFLFSSMI